MMGSGLGPGGRGKFDLVFFPCPKTNRPTTSATIETYTAECMAGRLRPFGRAGSAT